jgi:AcrR family transcriptional regulator
LGQPPARVTLTVMSPSKSKPGLRSDAERNREAILKSAMATFVERPDASVEQIAQAAGVTRQTVYAHYPSRNALVQAVQQLALDQTIALLDSARLDEDPPDVALERFLEASWVTASEHRIFDLPAVPRSPEDEYEGHRPLTDRLEVLVRRGQEDGIFDARLPAPWLVAAFISLAHAAGEEVRTGRLQPGDALESLKRSMWRLYGVDR